MSATTNVVGGILGFVGLTWLFGGDDKTDVAPTEGLNASQHTGIQKEALDDCGRLKPGYKYIKGGRVVKTNPKKPNGQRKAKKTTPKPQKAEAKKEVVVEKQEVKAEANDQKRAEKTETKVKKAPINKLVVDLLVAKINIDRKRFQNREKLNDTVLKQIVVNYSETKLDPVMVVTR